MATNVFELYGEIFLRDNKVNSQLAEVDNSARKTNKSFGSIAKKIGKFGLAAGAAAGVAGASIFAMANKAAGATDRVDKMSQRLGLSKKSFQEWDFVLSQNGVSIESMQSGMKNLSQRMKESAEGAGKGSEIFKKLGISALDSKGNFKEQEQVFNETVVALQGMEDGAEKAALSQELFGRSGQELLPLLNGTAEGVADLKNKANDLGLVLSDDAVKAGVEFTDQMDIVKTKLGAVASQIGVALMPVMANFMNWVIDNMPMIKDVFTKVFDILKVAVEGVGEAISILVDTFKTVSDWINNNQELVKTFAIILGSFALAWGLVTTAMAIYNIVAGTGAVVSGLLAGAIALITSPVTLVVLAIGALIAIGILLWRNWDTIKAKASELKNNIKTKFNEIKLAITTPITAAAETVRQKLQVIKDFFKNLVLNIPKPKIPHFSIRGKFDLIPPGISVPKLGVDWYARGTDNFKGGLAGINEKGGEIVNLPGGSQIIPHDISSQMAQNNGSNIVIETMNVRNDNDIKLIARELYNLQQNKNRALGVV